MTPMLRLGAVTALAFLTLGTPAAADGDSHAAAPAESPAVTPVVVREPGMPASGGAAPVLPEVPEGPAAGAHSVAIPDPNGKPGTDGAPLLPPPAKDKLVPDGPNLPQAPIPQSTPTGVESTGVSSQVLSLPQGAGKISGMGESFSNQLSTGTASYSVPISLPGARGGADPQLALSYSTGGAHGAAGVGWDIGVPFIARQTDRGNPGYNDPALGGPWAPTQDRFVFNGGQELVPICLVSGTTCGGAQPGESMPAWASGWQYFRPRVEGSFLRIFWAPNHQTWRVQDKNGLSMEIGVPLDGTSSAGTIEVDPNNATHIFRWNLSRQYDSYGAANPAAGATPLPVNVVRYRYEVDSSTSYLTDIYDTPPATAAAATADVTTYAHHVHLNYERRSDPSTSYRRGWQTIQAFRVTGIDVTSATFAATAGSPRKLVRRYHFTYDPNYHVSLLSGVQVEGRCGAVGAGEAGEPIAEDSDGFLPSTTGCPMLPAMTFGYTHVTPFAADGSPGVADLAGYEGFDERVTTMVASPPHSVDEANTDLFDINSDGLPDVLVTMPGLYNGQQGLYLNGVDGKANGFTATTMGVAGVLGDSTTTITLDNINVSSGDIDGDGIIDLVNMPQVKTYSVYTPVGSGTTWTWQGRAVTTAAAQSPKINLGNGGLNVQRMDVNGDGLVDVVLSQGTEMETFFSLDRYPGGDGQFGSAVWTSGTTAQISNDPVAACVPWDGLPVQLSDATMKVGDMNGDGLPDLVRVEQGNIHYWPGRGNGYWGTGAAASCEAGTFGESQYVAMQASPEFANPDTAAVRVDDVNGDGLDDLVIVNFATVEVYLNVDGVGWTAAHLIANAPASPAYLSRVRLADMNGSGTRDILWGDGGNYRFMDLAGGARPWILTHVENGLGKTTDISFASSTSLMLAARSSGAAWGTTLPMPVEVTTQMVTSDNLSVANHGPGSYVTTYSYGNPVWDGRQQEFRGFATATETHVGDANSPTSSAQSQFLLGQCWDDEDLVGLPSACTPAGRWRDNVREGLKGLPTVVQTYSAAGVYLSTVHHTYRLRLLYQGLDGREVRHAFESSSDTYLYDGAAAGGASAATPVTTSDVELELSPPAYSSAEETNPLPAAVATQQSGTMTLQGSAGMAHLQTVSYVDVFGNTFASVDNGNVGVDPVISHYSQPGEESLGATGWTWRTIDSYTTGSTDVPSGVLRNHTQQTYDPYGSPLVTSEVLVGTIALERSNAGTGGTAPAPTKASKDKTITTLTLAYDGFGNPTTSTAPNSRVRISAYDTTYSGLPTSDSIYVGKVSGAQGATALTTSAVSDRGLGAVITLTDVRGETTNVAFDGFGRVSKIFRPDPATGIALSVASTIIEYQLPSDAHKTPYSVVHTQVDDSWVGSQGGYGSDYLEAYSYIDGLGRTITSLHEADPYGGGDAAPWIAADLTTYDAKGAAKQKYLEYFYDGDPTSFVTTQFGGTSSARQTYDAFGRNLESFGLDGTPTRSNVYHALSVDAWDAADMTPTSGHYGTFATSLKDGHGRSVAVTERAYAAKVSQSYQTTTSFLSTGEPFLITRTNVGTKLASVSRWIRYDSLGRMVANVEPDTTVAFKASPSGAVPTQTWRYAYNDNGDLVGTSDARGCGANYTYDAGGRITGEDYSPCTADQAAYSSAVEVTYSYDAYDATTSDSLFSGGDFQGFDSWVFGRLASITDRSGEAASIYDGRGRDVGTGRMIAGPGGATSGFWYQSLNFFDALDRKVEEDSDGGRYLQTYTDFSARGVVEDVAATGSTGYVVSSIVHDADGKTLTTVYGDIAATTTQITYDARRRVSGVQTYRASPGLWTTPTSGYAPPTAGATQGTQQLLLQDLQYKYDVVDNPIEIDDYRIASDWPAGAQPVSRTMQYDDLYRVTHIAYQYPAGSDTWVSPFDAEDRDLTTAQPEPLPAPHTSFAHRVGSQTFAYDWLGNTTTTGDDAGGFYDRSLGTITNGTATAGPYQLASAASTTGASPGNLTTSYDAAGNMTGLSVVRGGPCLPSGAICSQQYVYSWDEVGRLARARRWDLASPGAAGTVPTTAAAADLAYTYDANDERIVKAATDPTSGTVHYDLYPLDAVGRRHMVWLTGGHNYVLAAQSELDSSFDTYVVAQGVRLGAIRWETVYPGTGEDVHTFLELPDHLGSTSITFDVATSEVVEARTYLPYGQAESDYRPERWENFREKYGFTGKEEDVQVGVIYVENRYLSPETNRWVSADPKAVHLLGADGNVYAYVHGRVLAATDPDGLQEAPTADHLSDKKAAESLAHGDSAKEQGILEQWDKAKANGAMMALQAGACIVLPSQCAKVGLAMMMAHPEDVDFILATDGLSKIIGIPVSKTMEEETPVVLRSQEEGAPAGGGTGSADSPGIVGSDGKPAASLAPPPPAAPKPSPTPVAGTPGAPAIQPTKDIQPTFVGQEHGPSVVVPKGAVGPSPVRTGKGFEYTGGKGGAGLSPKVASVRIMDPTVAKGPSPGYPSGYASYSNAGGQAVDPYSGRTLQKSDPWWHLSLEQKP